MSLMMTSAQGSRNQMRPSKMLDTKKLVGMNTCSDQSRSYILRPTSSSLAHGSPEPDQEVMLWHMHVRRQAETKQMMHCHMLAARTTSRIMCVHANWPNCHR